MKTRKLPTRASMLSSLRQGRVTFPPLTLQVASRGPASGAKREEDSGLVLSVRWGEKAYRFLVQCRARSNPKAVAEAVSAARQESTARCLNPLVLVPYLSPERLQALEQEGVSGLDLCGNGVVVVPGEVFVYRTGAPNRFRAEGVIKNVYRRNSSVVARVFLLVPEFDSVNAVLQEVNRRGGLVTLSTVSKVLSALDTDLVIDRGGENGSQRRRLRLLQAEKLLDLLTENYRPPAVQLEFVGKSSLPPDELCKAIAAWQRETGERAVRTGANSVSAYAVMAREDALSFYCTDVEGLTSYLGEKVRKTERFANLTLLETDDAFVYFDSRPGLVASPVQTYLELVKGDKRDQETAEQVRRAILAPLSGVAFAKDSHGPTHAQLA